MVGGLVFPGDVKLDGCDQHAEVYHTMLSRRRLLIWAAGLVVYTVLLKGPSPGPMCPECGYKWFG